MKKRPRMAHYLFPSHFIIKMRQFFVSLQAKESFDWATKWTIFIDQSESVLSHFTRRHKKTMTILKCQNLSSTWSRYDQHTERTTMSTTAAATKGPSVRTLKGLKCALSNREREREREREWRESESESRAVFVAQLVEQLLPTYEYLGSNSVIGNFFDIYLLSGTQKRKRKSVKN